MIIIRTSLCAGLDPMHVAAMLKPRGLAGEVVVVVHDVPTHGTQLDGTQANGTQPYGTQHDGTQANGTQLDGTQPNGTHVYDEAALDAFARATFALDDDGAPPAAEP